ncbi:hypothetical protein BDF21DRAFT_404068 [Thamnidium elegans]|nr:hypothetical protein BDF21DRAFT_404068 [Thamnidium elegans]
MMEVDVDYFEVLDDDKVADLMDGTDEDVTSVEFQVKVNMETLDTVEKTSIELKTQLKERNVSKHTTEFIYSFFNEYLSNANNVDQLRLINPYRCEKLMEMNVNILEPLSYDICKDGCYMYDLEENDTICPSERCKERRSFFLGTTELILRDHRGVHRAAQDRVPKKLPTYNPVIPKN